MTIMLGTHLAYLVIGIGITVWVARMQVYYGRIFAGGTEDSAPGGYVDAVSRLLQVGFYLLNLGIINLALRYGDRVNDLQGAVELLSTKIGFILLFLGLTHLVMTGIYSKMRRQVSWYNRGRNAGRQLVDPFAEEVGGGLSPDGT